MCFWHSSEVKTFSTGIILKLKIVSLLRFIQYLNVYFYLYVYVCVYLFYLTTHSFSYFYLFIEFLHGS